MTIKRETNMITAEMVVGEVGIMNGKSPDDIVRILNDSLSKKGQRLTDENEVNGILVRAEKTKTVVSFRRGGEIYYLRNTK